MMTSLAALLLGSCTLSPSYTLQFPDDEDLGEVWLREDVNCFTCGNGEEYIGRATGRHEVRLPAPHWYVSLRMRERASERMRHLAHPSLVHLGELDLRGSDVRDEDLRFVADINLRYVALSGTSIRGDGLRYLRPNDDWTFVDLRDCRHLDPSHLVHFRGWKRATIRVTDRGAGSTPYSAVDSVLLAEARRIICDGKPEAECRTQIR